MKLILLLALAAAPVRADDAAPSEPSPCMRNPAETLSESFRRCRYVLSFLSEYSEEQFPLQVANGISFGLDRVASPQRITAAVQRAAGSVESASFDCANESLYGHSYRGAGLQEGLFTYRRLVDESYCSLLIETVPIGPED